MYTLRRKQRMNCSLEEAWDFLADPSNLADITPPEMNFEIKQISLNQKTYQGQLIRYKVSILPGIRVTWITEISHVKEPEYFVDEQRFGPYRLWHHQHKLIPEKGGLTMIDEVNYVLPFGFLGRMMHSLFIRKKLERIFDYRKEVIDTLFNQNKSEKPNPPVVAV